MISHKLSHEEAQLYAINSLRRVLEKLNLSMTALSERDLRISERNICGALLFVVGFDFAVFPRPNLLVVQQFDLVRAALQTAVNHMDTALSPGPAILEAAVVVVDAAAVISGKTMDAGFVAVRTKIAHEYLELPEYARVS